MRKTIWQKIALTTLIISTFLTLSCSKQTDSMDEKYLDKVQTLDSTINSFYAAISSDNGQSFDWDLYRYVMHPEAKLIRWGPDKSDGYKSYALTYYTTDDYIKTYGKYMKNVGFYEKEIFREVTTFRSIGHVLSGYASYERDIKEPIIRGINSFQLLNDGKRWWIINAFYTRETPENPIPEKYFQK
jgi:hypothetical protein